MITKIMKEDYQEFNEVYMIFTFAPRPFCGQENVDMSRKIPVLVICHLGNFNDLIQLVSELF